MRRLTCLLVLVPMLIGLAPAVVSPQSAKAAGWDVHVAMTGAGGVSGTDALACASSASAPGASGGTCGKHYTVHPRVCVPILGCAGGPDPRPIELQAQPPADYDRVASWEGCDSVAGNTCNLRLPFPGLNQVRTRTVTVNFTDADRDNDGKSGADDCDDNDARRYVGAAEVPGNEVDENCDGVASDIDGDGYPEPADCADRNKDVHPDARDVPRNGVDEDCSGEDNRDADGDGYDTPADADSREDCDDANADVHPGTVDRPDNGIDEDCSGSDAHNADQDGDGYGADDCNDRNPDVHPGARDVPRNGIDEDCTGADNRDADGDGYETPAAPARPQDCDDASVSVHPGAVDRPDDGVDSDCDGKDATAPDRDGDGYDRPADCRDDNPAIHPDAHDVPRNTLDEDCDQADADYPAIRSDIRHAERGLGPATIIRRLSVTRPPAGARVRVRCHGRGCPLRQRRLTPAPGTRAVTLTRLFKHARLSPRTRVDIAVTAPATYGKVLRLTMRRGAPPKLAWLKLDPDSNRVSPW